jgi:uncharacterized Fe-S cluster-containing protein
MDNLSSVKLPGLDCGLCGFRTCDDFAKRLAKQPDLLSRCIHLSENMISTPPQGFSEITPTTCGGICTAPTTGKAEKWRDSLGREFDFYLEHFPEEPGPREIILPHNPMLTREMEVKKGEVLIGRPLGLSCGCPITHCGVAMEVDSRSGVIVWCVTGPLRPRQEGYKDLGYYIAEGYEGLVNETRCELKIGARHYFQPRMCMLQWRHSGLINYLNRNKEGWQVRLEGLWIG